MDLSGGSSSELSRVWKSHIDKLANRAGSPKDLVSVLSARGSQHSYARASSDVRCSVCFIIMCWHIVYRRHNKFGMAC